jgi:hypothetical protein
MFQSSGGKVGGTYSVRPVQKGHSKSLDTQSKHNYIYTWTQDQDLSTGENRKIHNETYGNAYEDLKLEPKRTKPTNKSKGTNAEENRKFLAMQYPPTVSAIYETKNEPRNEIINTMKRNLRTRSLWWFLVIKQVICPGTSGFQDTQHTQIKTNGDTVLSILFYCEKFVV